MQKFFCAIGFLTLALIFQDCLVPTQGVRVRVVKVKRQDNHYTKRQVSRTSYTDVPLAGDPDPDAESFQLNNNNNNNLRPEDNPYNAGNRPVDYPLNTNYDTTASQTPVTGYDDTNYDQTPVNRYGGSANPGSVTGHSNSGGFGSRQVVSSNDGSKRQTDNQQRAPRKDGEKGEDCPGCGHSIPGEAGVDYPNFHVPPKTAFSCSKQSYSGYYADVEARCQVFWICQKNRADAFLCPNGTIFNQQVFVCDWWFNSDCNTAPDYYSRNQYLYAGPAVDIFGNAITPYKAPPSTPRPQRLRATTATPVATQTADQLPAQQQQPVQRQSPQVQRVAQKQVEVLPQRQQTPVVQPQRQQQQTPVVQPPIRQQLPSQPQRQQQPAVQSQRQQGGYSTGPALIQTQQPAVQPQRQQQQQQQQQQQRVIPHNSALSQNGITGGYGSSVQIKRRSDYQEVSATAVAPVAKQYSPQVPIAPIKRSKLAVQVAFEREAMKQPYNNYPVPDNSLAAVDAEFGLKMNNYKAAVDYINSEVDQSSRQQQQTRTQKSYQSQSQKQYYAGTVNNNAGYTQQQQQQQQQQRQQRKQSSSLVAPKQVVGEYSSRTAAENQQYQRQPLFSSAEYEEVDASEGFGQKQQRSNVIVENVEPKPKPQPQASYSSTTKRNAIDYDTENTTPLTLSRDDELLSTLTTPRYGEVVSRSSVYSTESEIQQSQETTTVAPLTFGQKLTRAAKKRNTSNWGNWKTMLLGDY